MAIDPVTAILTGASIIGGFSEASAARKAGREAMQAARENAATLLRVTEENIALGLEAAGYNAAQIRALGAYNAAAVEAARDMNTALMAMESIERLRQHIRLERQTAGTIRAISGSSGLSVNEGTPLHYLNDEMDEMLRSRRYTAERDKLTILNYFDQESTRADLIRLESDMRADALLYNAEIEGQIAMNDAEARAEQMERSGQTAMATARIQAQSALVGGLLGGIQNYASYGGFSSPTPSATGYQFNPYPNYVIDWNRYYQ